MAQSAIVYGVTLFTMPVKQHVVYALEYKAMKALLQPINFYRLLIGMTRIELLTGLKGLQLCLLYMAYVVTWFDKYWEH